MISEEVLKRAKEGEIVIYTIDGLRTCKIENFINQPIDGMLYDLNRDEATLLTLMDEKEHPWAVNDYAMVQVLRYILTKNETKDDE